jgi:lipopolysaccharide/colanic/teichoic acid biosynthesis glycosyltransferase
MERRVVKRILDIVLSCSAIILLLPVFALIAVFIKVDSLGPIFFVQKRVGLNLEPFFVYKFRTMVNREASEIDQHSESVVASEGDIRITRIGGVLRRTSLDELPQLFNIIKGDMSIVGPRPGLIEQANYVPPCCMKRYKVRPGLTGLSQVSGRRGLGWLEQVKLDTNYVENASVIFDMSIILRTVKVLFSKDGVYGDEELNWRKYRDWLNGRSPRDEDLECDIR